MIVPSVRDMRRRQGEIDAALRAVAAALTPSLERRGWVRRPFTPPRVAAFTQPVGGGFVAGVEVDVVMTTASGPFFWPLQLTVRFGAGYEPAIALMPVLTLPPRAILVDDLSDATGSTATVAFNGPEDAALLAKKLATLIQKHEGRQPSTAPSMTAVDAALLAAADDQSEKAVQRRLLLLAATGRRTQARSVLESYGSDGHGRSVAFRRFARQLRRWLDAGGPTPPPVEQTLALPPQRTPRPPGPRWKGHRQRDRVRKQVREQLRPTAQGQRREELARLLAAGYAARGLDLPPLMTLDVKMTELEWSTFGRLRSALFSVAAVVSFPRALIQVLRRVPPPLGPDWMLPPETASYPLVVGGGRCATVQLDAQAAGWLAEVAAAGRRRAAGLVTLDVWLSEEAGEGTDPAPLVVHIGEKAVGTLSAQDALAYAPELAAARLYDEYVPVRGSLLPADKRGAAMLEIRLPTPLKRT